MNEGPAFRGAVRGAPSLSPGGGASDRVTRSRDAHHNGTDVFDRAWHVECDEWIVTFAPELKVAPEVTSPWGQVKARLGLD